MHSYICTYNTRLLHMYIPTIPHPILWSQSVGIIIGIYIHSLCITPYHNILYWRAALIITGAPIKIILVERAASNKLFYLSSHIDSTA